MGRVDTQTFAPGDRVRFEGSQTFSGNLYFDQRDTGTSSRPVTPDSYGSCRATIYAGDGDGVFFYNAAGLVLRNLNLVGAGTETNKEHGSSFLPINRARSSMTISASTTPNLLWQFREKLHHVSAAIPLWGMTSAVILGEHRQVIT